MWFNAWKYNQEQALWRVLLLLDDLESLLAKEPPPKPKEGEPAPGPSPEELLDLLRDALYREAIESAIRRRYQGEIKGHEYLEKIVQVSFVLPLIEAEPMRTYVQSLAPALTDPRCAEVFAVGLDSGLDSYGFRVARGSLK